ncbi:MAG: acyltransferase [candidate division KSB1 bacterium]|nr:acyltransferase [candidate division KSB1 bacterium]
MFEKAIYFLLRVFFGRNFSDPKLPWPKLIRFAFHQKILRRNARVPWPIHPTTVVKSPQKVQRNGTYPGLAPFCYLDARNGIIIGENTFIGPNVSIISMNHDIYDYGRYIKEGPVVIGRNCWICAGAIITPGVHLGDHTVVAAGAVVTKSFEGNVMIGGVPAQVIRRLEDYGSRPPLENAVRLGKEDM